MEWIGEFDTEPAVRTPLLCSACFLPELQALAASLSWRPAHAPGCAHKLLANTSCLCLPFLLRRTFACMQSAHSQRYTVAAVMHARSMHHSYCAMCLSLHQAGHVQGMAVMHEAIEDRMTAGFAGLRARLANWKSWPPAAMMSGLNLGNPYPGMAMQSSGAHVVALLCSRQAGQLKPRSHCKPTPVCWSWPAVQMRWGYGQAACAKAHDAYALA